MSWGVKYRCEFSDIRGLVWKWDFLWDGYAGTPITMQASGSPMSYEPLADADDLYEAPVRGIKADLRIISTSMFQYVEFFSVINLGVKVNIYQGANLYFTGYVQSRNYKEPYNDYPYEVTISATDGLGYLNDILYEQSPGVSYTGRKSDVQVLFDCLGKIGITSFVEIVNIYDTNMSVGVGDSATEQTRLSVDIYKTMDCHKVLEHLLSKWNALIRQKDGVFYIYRPKEIIALSYARVFIATSPTAYTKTNTTLDFAQFINRSGNASDLLDTNGGTVMIVPAAKKITLNQNYGSKESWINNWELNADTFDGTDFQGWNGLFVTHIGNVYAGEKSGVALLNNSTLGQTFAPNAKISPSDLITIEFDYGFFNLTSAPVSARVLLTIKQGSMYIYPFDDIYFEWSPVPSVINIAQSAPVGWTGWVSYKRQCKFSGLSSDAPISILISSIIGLGVYSCCKNIRFYASSIEILSAKTVVRGQERPYRPSTMSSGKTTRSLAFQQSLKEIIEKRYVITAAPEGNSLSIDYIAGDVLTSEVNIDNIIEQFDGALSSVNIAAAHVFNICFVRNYEMNNSLSLSSSTKLAITTKVGQVITVLALPNYDKFSITGWVAMVCDEAHTTTTDPTPTGDYLDRQFCTVDRFAQTLTFAAGVDLTNFVGGDNIVLYNAFLNYSFVGDQTLNPVVSVVGAPAWRSMMTGGGPMFRHSDGRFIWMFIGFEDTPIRGNIGYVSSTDMINWTIGNSDAVVYAASNFPDCASVNLTGNCYPVDGSPGDYWCLVFYGQVSDGHGVHRIFYFDEDFTTFSYSGKLMADVDLGFAGGSILKIGAYYHLIYMLITAAGEAYRSINAAKCATLDGTYVNYQTNIVRGIDANDGMAWSYGADAPCIFNDGEKIFGIFGAQAEWSQSGLKGNREYCLLDFNPTTEVWSASINGPAVLNPLYYQDMSGAYLWAGDHAGGYLSIFIEGDDVYMSMTMKGSVYQMALLKINNIGTEKPTAIWNTRGGTEAQPLLQLIGEEMGLQMGQPRLLISGYPIYDTTKIDNDAHFNILGSFQDSINKVGGVNRKFVFNRGVLDVKNRLWNADLIEIIE